MGIGKCFVDHNVALSCVNIGEIFRFMEVLNRSFIAKVLWEFVIVTTFDPVLRNRKDPWRVLAPFFFRYLVHSLKIFWHILNSRKGVPHRHPVSGNAEKDFFCSTCSP